MTGYTDQVVEATASATSVRGLVTRDAISTTNVNNLVTRDATALYIGVGGPTTRDTTPATVARAAILTAASSGLITEPLALATPMAMSVVWWFL